MTDRADRVAAAKRVLDDDRLAVEVSEILRATGTTAIWVTHDHDEAAAIADRIVELT